MYIKVFQLSSPDGPVSHVAVIKTPAFKTRLVQSHLIEMNEDAKVSDLKPLIMEKFDTNAKVQSLIQVYELSDDHQSRVAKKPSDVLDAGALYGFVDLSLPQPDSSFEKLKNAAINHWQLTVGKEWPGIKGYTQSFQVRYQQDGEEKGTLLHLGLPGVGEAALTNFKEQPNIARTLVNYHNFENDGVAMMCIAMITNLPTNHEQLEAAMEAVQRVGRAWSRK